MGASRVYVQIEKLHQLRFHSVQTIMEQVPEHVAATNGSLNKAHTGSNIASMVCTNKCKRVHGTDWNTLLLHLVSGNRHFQSCSCFCYILSGYALSLYNTHGNTRMDHFQLQRQHIQELQLLVGCPTDGTQLQRQESPSCNHKQCPNGQGERPLHDLLAQYSLPPVEQTLLQLCDLV